MPQCTSGTFSRVERAGPDEPHARPDRPPPSINRWTGRLSTNATSRRRHDSVCRTLGADQGAPAPESGGAGAEAKTRELDQKIVQADEALRRLKEVTELTGSSSRSLENHRGQAARATRSTRS
jgi:hypothetical protein